MKNIAMVALVTLGLMGAASAFADDGVYVLGGVGKAIAGDGGRSAIDNLVTAAGGADFSSTMSEPATYKLEVGYQLDDNLALEGGYIGSKTVNYSAAGGNLNSPVLATSRINGWNLVGVATAPLGNGFGLLGKFGFANMQVLGHAKSSGFSDFTSGGAMDITFGIGAKYDFTKQLFVRLDVDRFSVGSSNVSSRSTIATLNFGYKFF
ncbi:MAG: outer membrane beta-barrel protein [Burkholderiaceae bacterium]|nr:outer membrane beta-barrel protein [Burkholderiaceae bacterium]